MGRVNKPLLSEGQRKELETNLKSSNNHAFRMRCQSILLKADGRKSKDVGQIVGMCHVSRGRPLGLYYGKISRLSIFISY